MDKEKKNTEKKINVQNLIENLVRKAQIALDAFDDQCTPANPRLPLVSELHEIYKNIYPAKNVVKEEKKEKALV